MKSTFSLLFISLTFSLYTCYAAVVSPNNLLLRFSFDSEPIHDVSPYQRNAVWANAATSPVLVAGKFGKACQFNPNAGDKTDAFYTGQWQAGTQFSAMSWVSFSNLGGYPKILSQKNGFQDKKGWEFQFNNGQFSLVTGGNGANSQGKTYNLNTWYHIAMTVNNGAVKFYLDGVDMTADGDADVIQDFGGKDITVGASANGNKVNDGGQWHGALDEVRVYDFAMTPDQILAVKNEDASLSTVANPNTPLTKIQDSCLAANASGALASSIELSYLDLPVANGQIIPGRSSEYMSFSYFASHIADGGQVKTTGTLRVKNVGTGALTIKSVAVAPATQDTGIYFTANGINNGQQIPAGGSADINVNFNNYNGLRDKTVIHNFMTISSSDAARPEIVVTLAGIYMTKKEGGDEIALQSVVNALGLAVNTGVGYVSEGIEYVTNPLIGDGFSSFLLKTADSTLPVWLQTVASFSPCCNQGPGVQLNNGQCAIRIQTGFTQSVYPQKQGGGTAFATCQPTTNFWLLQDGQWASNSAASAIGMIAMHMAPARDQDGQLIKNAYILGQDYSLEKGCGFETGQANCDFNDNQFYIQNVAPADSAALDRSAVVDLPISAAFDHTFSSGLVDSLGNFIGFPQYTFSTKLDTSIRIGSYQPSLITLDTTNKVLKLKATPGTLNGAEGTLVNGLRYPIDPAKRSFAVSATVANVNSLPAAASAGVFLGSDQDNFVSLTVQNGVISAYAELYSFYQLQKGGDIGFEPTIKANPFNLGNVTLPSGTTKVELVIFANPTDGTTGSISFGYNIGQGVVLIGGAWKIPGRNPTTGLGSSGRIVGFGTAAGILAFGADAEVSFSDFSVSTCASTSVNSAPTGLATSDNTPTDTSANDGTLTSAAESSNESATGAVGTSAIGDQGVDQTLSGVNRGQTGSARVLIPSLFVAFLALFSI
eukprot:TRINITY_DN7289_c0_g1_i1.p1 TRINITY_DN7289_c0_g1~~TRINITY_DN7289_c0_g1_i1.p1  ORF type:complete len:938 (-),score=317.40 TRINITY_DN7289_c0_g1_i1:20-2833(-)